MKMFRDPFINRLLLALALYAAFLMTWTHSPAHAAEPQGQAVTGPK